MTQDDTKKYYVQVHYLDSDGAPQTGEWRDSSPLERARSRQAALSRVIRAWFRSQGCEVLSVQLVVEDAVATEELSESDFGSLPAVSGSDTRS